eukprot:5549528-Amphidinium_carterae.1
MLKLKLVRVSAMRRSITLAFSSRLSKCFEDPVIKGSYHCNDRYYQRQLVRLPVYTSRSTLLVHSEGFPPFLNSGVEHTKENQVPYSGTTLPDPW